MNDQFTPFLVGFVLGAAAMFFWGGSAITSENGLADKCYAQGVQDQKAGRVSYRLFINEQNQVDSVPAYPFNQ